MRIGLFTDQYYPSISGIVTSIKMLYDGLTALGHEVYIFTSYDEDKIDNNDELNFRNVINIPGKSYPFKDLKDYRFSFKHRKYISMVAPYNLDVIHIHTEFSVGKIGRVSGKKLGIPVVHTFHTLYEDYIKTEDKSLREIQTTAIAVEQYSLTGEYISSFNSIAEAGVPHAGKTVLCFFNELSKYTFTFSFTAKEQTPPTGCPTKFSTSSNEIMCAFS